MALFEKKDGGTKMNNKKAVSPNNIWNKEGFRMCGLGEKSLIIAKIKHIGRCIRWSKQRIERGYAECDRWDMDGYLQRLIPEMLQDLRDNRLGSPAYLGENYTNDKGMVVNDTCHEKWNKILDRMIFLWRESTEDFCSKKNPYDEEYHKAHDAFEEKYGLFGKKLQTEEEREKCKQRGGGCRVHHMYELPEYKAISDKYFAEEYKIDAYRVECKNEALDLLKEHFFALWD